MAEDRREAALGRGLAALIGDVGDEAPVVGARRGAAARVPIEFIAPTRAIRARSSTTTSSTSSPRRSASTASCSRSWCGRSPAPTTATRSSPASGAGGRRSAPGCTTCRSLIHDVSDREALELAIVENVQRADLNPLEEARGYQQLIEEFGYTPGRPRRDDRQEPAACRQHAAAPEAAASACRPMLRDGKLIGRPRARAGRRRRSGGGWRGASSRPGCRSATPRRSAQRRASKATRQAQPAQAQGRRHAGAREGAVRRARPRRSTIEHKATAAARCASATRRSSSSTRSAGGCRS